MKISHLFAKQRLIYPNQCNFLVIKDNVVHITATFGLVTGQTTVASDVTSKYNKLGEPYQQGFILETFKAMPGVGKIGWNANETPYQGIFSRPLGYGNSKRNKIKCNQQFVNFLLFPIIIQDKPKPLGSSKIIRSGMLIGKYELNSKSQEDQSVWAWPKPYLNPKRYH